MTSPHDLINVAADDVAVATRLMATQPVNDANVKTHIRNRLDCAQAGALVAIAALLHEHFHGDHKEDPVDPDFAKHLAKPGEWGPASGMTSEEAELLEAKLSAQSPHVGPPIPEQVFRDETLLKSVDAILHAETADLPWQRLLRLRNLLNDRGAQHPLSRDHPELYGHLGDRRA